MYLAIGLAQSVYANMSAELDSPHKTREPSVFRRIDRALSFPVASAAPTRPRLLESYPEFLRGTTQHEKSHEKIIEKTFQTIDDTLYDYLQGSSSEPKVVFLLENHLESTPFKLLTFSYVSALLREKNTKVTVIHEAGVTSADAKIFMMMYQRMKEAKTKETVEQYLKSICFKGNQPDRYKRISGLVACTVQAIGAYQFELVLASAHDVAPHKTGKELFNAKLNSYNLQTSQLISLDLPDLKAVDTSLRNAVSTTLTQSKPNDVVIVVTGNLHGHAMAALMDELDHAYRMLLIDKSEKMQEIMQDKLYQQFLHFCIKRLEHCPSVLQMHAHKRGVEYCVDGNYAPRQNCDEAMHDYMVTINKYFGFLSSPKVTKFPAFLPDHYPQTATFFAPKSSVKMLKDKLAQDKKESENKDNNRMEL